MPKRRHDDYQDVLTTVVNDMIRYAVFRGHQKGNFRREHLKDLLDLRHTSMQFDQIVASANTTLQKVYGLRIDTILEAKKAKQYVVVDDLSPQSRARMGDLWQTNSTMRKPTNDRYYWLPSETASNAPLSNYQLVKLGLLTLTVLLVVTAENNLGQDSLRKSLGRFGMPTLENQSVSSLNSDTSSVISEFVKKGYLVDTKQDNEVYYKLGWRAIHEFPPKTLFELFVTTANNNSREFANTVCKTIVTAFGDACEFTNPHHSHAPARDPNVAG